MGSADRFSYEWTKFSKITPNYEKQFLNWVYPLKPKDFRNQKVLDAGCGTGRNSYWPLVYGAKSVFAFDADSKIASVANKNLKKFKNVKVQRISIYDLKLKFKFDIVLCIGVLHHLEDPKLAIEKLAKVTKKGGKIVFWVYGYEGNELLIKLINPLRFVTSKISPRITNLVSYFFSIPLYICLKTFPQKRPYFSLLSKFSFWHIHSIVLDQLLPKIANYWTEQDLKNLFKNKIFSKIIIYPVNKMSWSVIAEKN